MDTVTISTGAQQLANLSPVLKAGLGAAVGTMLSPVNQAVIEHSIASISGVPAIVKVFLPSIFSAVCGWIATLFGIDPVIAGVGATAMAGVTHVVNGTSIAAVSDPPKG